jgi:hypothetical protein
MMRNIDFIPVQGDGEKVVDTQQLRVAVYDCPLGESACGGVPLIELVSDTGAIIPSAENGDNEPIRAGDFICVG